MDLLLTNARLPDGRTGMTIGCRGERIAALLPPGTALPAAGEVRDLGGALVLPGLVDGHMHLDKTTLGLPWIPHAAGPTRLSRIETDARLLPGLPLDTEARATAMIRRVVPFGTAHIRSHVDITPVFGLTALEGVLAAREAHRHMVRIETVAFPQAGILRAPGTLELLDAALRAGADLVGGLDPCEVDRDPKGHLDAVFGLAEKHGKGIDIHLHEAGELGLFTVQEFCARVVALGMQGRATISHGFCLGGIGESKQQAAAALLAESGVALATHGAGGASLPPLGLLRGAGVRILCGHDNLRDTWGPYGSGDMLERAAIIGWRADWRMDAQLADMLAMVTVEGARALGAEGTGIEEGGRADFFSVWAENGQEAIAQHPGRGVVVFGGRVVG